MQISQSSNHHHQAPADLFDLTFEALRQSLHALQRSSSTESVENDTPKSESIEKRLLDQLWLNMQQTEYKKLEKVQEQHHLVDQRFLHLLDLQQRSLQQVQSSLERMLCASQQQQITASLRISQQSNISERRLQDLMMEVIGEYGKTLTRSQRREEYLLHNSHVEIIMTTWKYLWKRFIMRMRFDILNGKHQASHADGNQPPPSLHLKLSIQVLSLPQDQQEFVHILKKLNKKVGLVSDHTYIPYTIIRIARNSVRVLNSAEQTKPNKSSIAGKEKQMSSNFANQAVKIAHYKKDLLSFFDEIGAWVSSSTRTINGASNLSPRLSTVSNRKLPTNGTASFVSHPWKELLSNISFAWQFQNMMSSTIWDEVVKVHSRQSQRHIPEQVFGSDKRILQFTKNLQYQYNTSVFSNRVYFCVEERSLAHCRGLLNDVHLDLNSNASYNMESSHLEFLTALQELYTDYPHTMATLQSSTLRVAHSEGSTTDEQLDMVLIELKRMFQYHPFQIISFETKHQHIHKLKFPISQRHNKSLLDELACFPAVIKAQSMIDETILHFAPASTTVLFEALQSQKSNLGFLPTLFCPILSADKMSLLKSGIGRTENPRNSLSNAITLTTDTASSTFETQNDENGNKQKSDCSIVFVFPLNQSCVESLEAHYFPSQQSIFNSSALEGWSCMRILPDELRNLGVNSVLGGIGSTKATTSSLGHANDLNPAGGDKLNSAYVLMSDENSFSLQKAVDSNGNKIVQSVYYLIQLRMINSKEPISLHGSNQQFSGAHDIECSVYDDESFGPYDLSSSLVGSQIPGKQISISMDERLFQHCMLSYLRQFVGDDVLVCGVQHADGEIKPAEVQNGVPRANISSKQNGPHTEVVDDTSTASKKYSHSMWDTSILSSICYWRSCMCEAAGFGGPEFSCPSSPKGTDGSSHSSINLCMYHSEMKKFLDSKATKGSNLESSKYLPKKPPSFGNQYSGGQQKKDLLTIRAASTLLQELWDGRLKSTVKLFAKKMMTDMKFRSFLESQLSIFIKYHGQHLLKQRNTHRSLTGNKTTQAQTLNDLSQKIIPSPPTWTLWKNKEYLESTSKGQRSSLELLNYIYSSEQLISQEIAGFLKLQCFPNQELSAIRKEIKSFKDQQEQMLSSSQYLSSAEPLENAAQDKHQQGKRGHEHGGNGKDKEDGYDNLVAILEEESKLCERKLQILGQRREFEEESRLHTLRKAAKIKALEDVQSKDPNSFRNQGGRF